jgi:hypothetical protein
MNINTKYVNRVGKKACNYQSPCRYVIFYILFIIHLFQDNHIKNPRKSLKDNLDNNYIANKNTIVENEDRYDDNENDFDYEDEDDYDYEDGDDDYEDEILKTDFKNSNKKRKKKTKNIKINNNNINKDFKILLEDEKRLQNEFQNIADAKNDFQQHMEQVNTDYEKRLDSMRSCVLDLKIGVDEALGSDLIFFIWGDVYLKSLNKCFDQYLYKLIKEDHKIVRNKGCHSKQYLM